MSSASPPPIVERGTATAAYYTTMAFVNTYMVTGLFLFWKRRKTASCRKRMVYLVMLGGFCEMMSINVAILSWKMFSVIPQVCAYRLVIQTLFAPMWLYANFLRASNLLYMSIVNQLYFDLSININDDPFAKMPTWKKVFLRFFSRGRQIEGTSSSMETPRSNGGPTSHGSSHGMNSEGGMGIQTRSHGNDGPSLARTKSQNAGARTISQEALTSSQGGHSDHNIQVTANGSASAPGTPGTRRKIMQFISIGSRSNSANPSSDLNKSIPILPMSKYTGFSGLSLANEISIPLVLRWVSIFFVVELAFLIFSISYWPNDLMKPVCMEIQFIGRNILQIAVLFTTPIILWLARDIQDSYNLKWEIFISQGVYWPLFIINLVQGLFLDSTSPFYSPFFGVTLYNALGYFFSFSVTVFFGLAESYLEEYRFKRFQEENEKASGTIDQSLEGMLKMLKNPNHLKKFKEQLLLEMSLENASFYEETLQLRKQYANDPTSAKLVNRLNHVYEHYVVSGSPQELNLTDKARIQYRDALKNNVIHLNMLDPIFEEVVVLMYRNTFPKYLKRLKTDEGLVQV